MSSNHPITNNESRKNDRFKSVSYFIGDPYIDGYEQTPYVNGITPFGAKKK